MSYRIKSQRGVQFRQWATRVLREHLVQGYTFNQTRLAERGLLEARQTLDLLARTLQNQSLVDETGGAVLELIVSYADTWRLLLEYDEDRLPLPPGVRPFSGVLGYDQASRAIADFERELLARGEATPLFARLYPTSILPLQRGGSEGLLLTNNLRDDLTLDDPHKTQRA